jgi:ketosteroid isomerase-like protein
MATKTTNQRDAQDTRDGRAVVEDLYAAISERDADGATHLLAEDVTWTVPDSLPAGGAYHGREAVGAYLSRLVDTWHELEHRPERFVEDDRHVVVTGESAMTASKHGERDRVPFAHVMRIDGGRIASVDEFTDTVRITRLLGSPAS